MVGVERADHDPTVVRHDATRLDERLRAIDEVEHERHRHPVEPPVTERQLLGCSPPDADAGGQRLACDGDHLGALVDAPRLGMRLGDEGGEQPPRPAADIEDAPAAKVTELDHRRERVPPRGVGRSQRVVDAGAGAEVRWVGRAHSSGWRVSPGRGFAGRRGERGPARRARR